MEQNAALGQSRCLHSMRGDAPMRHRMHALSRERVDEECSAIDSKAGRRPDERPRPLTGALDVRPIDSATRRQAPSFILVRVQAEDPVVETAGEPSMATGIGRGGLVDTACELARGSVRGLLLLLVVPALGHLMALWTVGSKARGIVLSTFSL